MVTNEEIQDKIITARITLLLKHPFLGVLSFHLKVMDVTESLPTMATDGKHLFYNRDFVDKLTSEELLGVLAHEIMHCVYQHTSKWRNTNKIQVLWKIAMEYPTNEAVVEMFKLPLPGYKEGNNINEIFISKDFYDMTADEIYEKLLKKNKRELEKMKNAGSGKIRVFIDDHDYKNGSGEEEGHKNQSPSEIEAISKQEEHEWKMKIIQAVEAQKKKGNIPAGLERFIDELIEPKVPWKQVLAEYLTSLSRVDYSWKVPNRRHLYRNIILPGIRSEQIEIAVAFDTSGSISQEELSEFAAELKGIMQCYPSYKMYLMGCDAKVYGYQEVGPYDDIDFKGIFKGHGGTDFRPVFTEIKNKDIRPAALLYFTDTYGEFPKEEPEYPVLWIVSEKYNIDKKSIPFGQVIEM